MLIEWHGFVPFTTEHRMATGGEQGFENLVAQQGQSGHCLESMGSDFIAAAVSGPAHQLLTAQLLQVVRSLTGWYGWVDGPLKVRTLAARSEAVNPCGAVDRATTACITVRMRSLLQSMPPTFVCPTSPGSGNCSRASSAMKQASMAWSASRNRSTIPCIRSATQGKL